MKPWETQAHQQPVRPSLQALRAASAPPTLADSLDQLEEVLVAFSTDLDQLVERLAPLLHPEVAEDDPVPVPQPLESVADIVYTAPAVSRVQDARQQLRAMHDQLFEVASRIAL